MTTKVGCSWISDAKKNVVRWVQTQVCQTYCTGNYAPHTLGIYCTRYPKPVGWTLTLLSNMYTTDYAIHSTTAFDKRHIIPIPLNVQTRTGPETIDVKGKSRWTSVAADLHF